MFNTTSTPTIEEKNKIVHDEMAHKLKKLSTASDNYYTSYLNLCKAKDDYITAQENVKLMEQLLLKSKYEYDEVINKLTN